MKERYTPTEPLKVGAEVTFAAGREIFEVIRPHLKKKMAQDFMKFYSLFDRSSR
jgi:hypothetical protein